MAAAKLFLLSGSALAGLSVLLGAFAAHSLKSRISVEMLAVFQTGVHYQMIHAVSLLLIGLLATRLEASWYISVAGWMLFIGIILFSGSLYVLSLSEIRWVGPVTPVGGLAFLLGWLFLFIGILRSSV